MKPIKFKDNFDVDHELTWGNLYCVDCMYVMRLIPDKYFDLAIVDPPYGDPNCKWLKNARGRFGGRFDMYKKYLDVAPPPEYFDELFRVSKHQIIWGGNYYVLPPTSAFVIWRKLSVSESHTFAMCEYAWTSFRSNAKVFECAPQGTSAEKRFHPTQKPVALYQWLLKNYAKPGDRILDTHAGSASSLVACHGAGYDYIGFEIDKDYYKAAQDRLTRAKAQMDLFRPEPDESKQTKLFEEVV